MNAWPRQRFRRAADERLIQKVIPVKDLPLERLGDVLATSLRRMEMATRLDEYGVWPIWNDIVGEPVARNAQPEKIRNGTLFVKCSSPVWMHQLQFMKQMIAENLNQRLRREIVKNIFFVVGRIDESGVSETIPAPPPTPRSAVDAKPDDGFVQSIDDPEIREAFKNLLKSYTRRKQKS